MSHHHISEDVALILAVLDHDDPERHAAFAHAEACVPCRRLLQRGASLLSIIDGHKVEVKVDPRLKARILASIDRLEDERSRTRWEPYALAIGALLSVVLALADPHAREGLFPAHAWRCFLWQLLGASLSLTGVSLWARGWAWRSSPLRLAVVTMGGALLSQIWLSVRCPTRDAQLHVLSFHVTGVLLAAMLGYALARARWPSRHRA